MSRFTLLAGYRLRNVATALNTVMIINIMPATKNQKGTP
jgi:hypothetical protein